MELIFLGNGGGRWMTITQKLHTGGFRIHDTKCIHVDPGAAAIARTTAMKINPLKTHGVLVSHCHPDHYTDAEIFIEAMTNGMRVKRGSLGASRSVILGADKLGPAISTYHRKMIKDEHILTPGSNMKLDEVGVEALPTVHSDPEGVGFKFYTNNGIVTYTGDTEYFDEMSDIYQGANILILNTLRPGNDSLKWHLCSNDVIHILKEVRPETAIITHFGMKMMGVSNKEAERIQAKSGVKTLSAKSGMRLRLE